MLNRVIILGIMFTILSGCASSISNSNFDITNSKTLDVNRLTKNTGTKELYVLFELNEDNVKITNIKYSLEKHERSEIDQYNDKRKIKNGDSLKGCLAIGADNRYIPCSHSVFTEVNFAIEKALMGALLYPITALMVVSGNGDDIFTNTKVDAKSVHRLGTYLETKLALRRHEILYALSKFGSLPNNQYFIPLVTKLEIQKAIRKANTPVQVDKLERLILSLRGNLQFVTISKLNVRQKATTRSRVVGSLKKNQIVHSLNTVKGWVQTQNGWVSSKYIENVKASLFEDIRIRRNKVRFNQSSQQLLANKRVSSKSISNLLNSQSGLSGVSQKQVRKLKSVRQKVIEREKFEQAKKRHTIADYATFLTLYPTGKYKNKVESLREPLWFLHAKKQNSISLYTDYLSIYPDSGNVGKVRQMWLDLVKGKNTGEAFNNFIGTYSIGQLEREADSLWLLEANQKNSIDSYRYYLRETRVNVKNKDTEERLSKLWFADINSTGSYTDVDNYLQELSNSPHHPQLKLVLDRCPEISKIYFTTKNKCVSNYLNIKKLRDDNSFQSFARAYALTGQTNDYVQAQKLAITDIQKFAIEYFSILALADKSRLFNIEIEDKHEYGGSKDHMTWFAQNKSTAAAKIKGLVMLKLSSNAPFSIKYGTYKIMLVLNVTASYQNKRRSNWVGNKEWKDEIKKTDYVQLHMNGSRSISPEEYDFGEFTVAYKDKGMMGGYTLYYLEKELRFTAEIISIKPITRLNIFKDIL